MSSSSYGVLVTWHNSMSSCKFWKIFSTFLTLHFVSILILWFCYLSVEIKIGIVGINRYFFLKVCIYKEVKNTESSYVGVGYTDCLGQMSASFQVGILILRCNPTSETNTPESIWYEFSHDDTIRNFGTSSTTRTY